MNVVSSEDYVITKSSRGDMINDEFMFSGETFCHGDIHVSQSDCVGGQLCCVILSQGQD